MSARSIAATIIALFALFASAASANARGPAPAPDWINVVTSYQPINYGEVAIIRTNQTNVFDGNRWVDARHNARITTVYRHGDTFKRLRLLDTQRVVTATINYVGVENLAVRASVPWSGVGLTALRRTMVLWDDGELTEHLVRIDSIFVQAYDSARPIPPTSGSGKGGTSMK